MENRMLKSVVTVLALVSSLFLLNACHRNDSNPLTTDTHRDPKTDVEPVDCEVPGDSFGIVGGRPLAIKNPLSASTVLLLHEDSKDSENISACTGTLIDRDTILTAAHCVEKSGAGKTVAAFTNNMTCAAKAQSRTMRKIVAQVIHADYIYGDDPVNNAASDIAVLKFEGELPLGYEVRNLPLRSYDLALADELIMSGYGKTNEDDDESLGLLRFTRTPRTRLSNQFYSTRQEKNIVLKDVHVIEQYDTGVCHGDSGGPLYTWNGHELVLIGVTSAGVDSRAGGRFPTRPRVCHGVSLFVDIRAKLDWIAKARLRL